MSTYAQTVKTEAARRIGDIDTQIAALELRISQAAEQRKTLLEKYTAEYKDVVAVEVQLTIYRAQVAALEAEKKLLARKEFVRTLPNTNIELLKIIAMQNERIIDLLETLAKRPR